MLTFHDVLAVYSVLHEGHGAGVAVLIGGGPHRWRLDDDVVDDAAGHQEVGDENEEQHLVGRRLPDPCRPLQLQVGHGQDGENGA